MEKEGVSQQRDGRGRRQASSQNIDYDKVGGASGQLCLSTMDAATLIGLLIRARRPDTRDCAPLFGRLAAEREWKQAPPYHTVCCQSPRRLATPKPSRARAVTLLRRAARGKDAAAHPPGVRAGQEQHPCTPELRVAAISFVDLTTTTPSPSPSHPTSDIHPPTCLPPTPRKPGSVSRPSSRAAHSDSAAAAAELPRAPSAGSQVSSCSAAACTSPTMRSSTVSRSGGSFQA
jgi:hypothetical protein